MAGARVVMLTGIVTVGTPVPLRVAEPVAGHTPWIVKVLDAPAASVRVSGVRFWRQCTASFQVIVTGAAAVFLAVIEPQAVVCPVGIPMVNAVGAITTSALTGSTKPQRRLAKIAAPTSPLFGRQHARLTLSIPMTHRCAGSVGVEYKFILWLLCSGA
jgi:hypothetical protein